MEYIDSSCSCVVYALGSGRSHGIGQRYPWRRFWNQAWTDNNVTPYSLYAVCLFMTLSRINGNKSSSKYADMKNVYIYNNVMPYLHVFLFVNTSVKQTLSYFKKFYF